MAAAAGGGAAPVDGDHAPGQEPAHAGDRRAGNGAGASERAPEPQADASSAAAPSPAEASAAPARAGGGASTGYGDAASARPARTERARDSAPTARAGAPQRAPDPPRDPDGGSRRTVRAQRHREQPVAETIGTRSDAPAEGPAGRQQTEPATYRVRPGDSLWQIASRQLGPTATATATARVVSRLWQLNRQRIATGNPDLIFPGQTLEL